MIVFLKNSHCVMESLVSNRPTNIYCERSNLLMISKTKETRLASVPSTGGVQALSLSEGVIVSTFPSLGLFLPVCV